MAEWTKHEKTRTRRDLMRVKVTPTGLQQVHNSPGNSVKTDLVVPPVVPLDAKTAELMAIWDQLDGEQREQALDWLRERTKHASG